MKEKLADFLESQNAANLLGLLPHVEANWCRLLGGLKTQLTWLPWNGDYMAVAASIYDIGFSITCVKLWSLNYCFDDLSSYTESLHGSTCAVRSPWGWKGAGSPPSWGLGYRGLETKLL